jgi:DNA-binding IclR family transcriptional regulator
MTTPKKTQQGINSVVIGIKVLDAIVESGSALSLNAISSQVDMAPAKVHRYLVSLVETGLVQRMNEPGLYDLGPKALNLGLNAIRRIDRISLANEELVSLNNEIDETVFLSIWSTDRAMVVGRKVSSRSVALMVRIGGDFSPIYTATGRLYMAFLEETDRDQILRAYSSLPSKPIINGKAHNKADFIKALAAVRTAQRSIGEGDFMPGFTSIAAPVFGPRGKIEFVITVIGHNQDMGAKDMSSPKESESRSRIEEALITSTKKLTEKLGSWDSI